jgi:hypothetical protein
VAKSYIVIIAMFFHLLGLEFCCILCNDFDWTTKPGKNIVLQKLNDNNICGLPGGNCLNPLGELIFGCQYPLVLS